MQSHPNTPVLRIKEYNFLARLASFLQRTIPCVQVAHQSPAVLGLALIAKAEDLGSSMAQRTLEHLLQYGEPPVR